MKILITSGQIISGFEINWLNLMKIILNLTKHHFYFGAIRGDLCKIFTHVIVCPGSTNDTGYHR